MCVGWLSHSDEAGRRFFLLRGLHDLINRIKPSPTFSYSVQFKLIKSTKQYLKVPSSSWQVYNDCMAQWIIPLTINDKQHQDLTLHEHLSPYTFQRLKTGKIYNTSGSTKIPQHFNHDHEKLIIETAKTLTKTCGRKAAKNAFFLEPLAHTQ